MRELAARWSELMLEDVPLGEPVTRAVRETGSLLRRPATEQQVAEAEARLGCELPPSYREFLLVSDGAYGDLYGAMVGSGDGWELPSPQSAVVGVGFLPVSDVGWLRVLDPHGAEMWGETGSRGPATEDCEEVWPWGPVSRGLMIAVDRAPGTTCLVPFEGAQEWQVWNVHKETATAHLSFRSLLERQVAEREPVTTVEEVRDVIERARAGDWTATFRLSKVTAPDAVPLLVELIASRHGPGTAVLGLGCIGTDAAVDALEAMPAATLPVAGALARAGTDRARDLLAARGAFIQLANLGDERATEIALGYVADPGSAPYPGSVDLAVGVLGRSGDPRAVPVLLPLLSDTHGRAVGAALALVRLGSPEGRRAIEVLAETEGPQQVLARVHRDRLHAAWTVEDA